MSIRRFKVLLILCLATVLPAGCSRQDRWEKNRPKVYKSGGIVRMDGQPLEKAVVTFNPVQGEFGGTAVTDASGKFQLTTFKDFDGVTEGEFQVAVEKIDWVPIGEGKPATATAPKEYPPLQKVPMTPAVYADFSKSGFTATITPKGQNQFEFNLDSKAK
ncbi:carboxypeptidase-like regulatory domain-containing protein [Planctomicrobium sp. SH661]|uniref:carboxypeptidase-like regulatory domain-containing protein n=1 Tax=Planctomicrobium sp. SH661 TaxID=3448124 RepID=UPI003F5C6742